MGRCCEVWKAGISGDFQARPAQHAGQFLPNMSRGPTRTPEHQALLLPGVPGALARCRSYFTETTRKSRRVAP